MPAISVRRLAPPAVVASAGLTALVGPAEAAAATTIGQTFTPPEGVCGDATDLGTTSPGSAYAAPSAGVISRENVDLASRICEAFNRRDLGAMLALMDEEVEIEPRFGALEGDYRGHQGVRRWWSSLLDVLPDYVAEVEELHGLGEVTLGRILGRGHGAASSAPLLETWWQLSRWRGGRCLGWSNFATEAEAFEAIGRAASLHPSRVGVAIESQGGE